MKHDIASWELTHCHIPQKDDAFESMIFLFFRWDMLVRWRVPWNSSRWGASLQPQTRDDSSVALRDYWSCLELGVFFVSSWSSFTVALKFQYGVICEVALSALSCAFFLSWVARDMIERVGGGGNLWKLLVSGWYLWLLFCRPWGSKWEIGFLCFLTLKSMFPSWCFGGTMDVSDVSFFFCFEYSVRFLIR